MDSCSSALVLLKVRAAVKDTELSGPGGLKADLLGTHDTRVGGDYFPRWRDPQPVCVFLPKLRLLVAAAGGGGEQQPDHGGHQQAQKQADPHVAALVPDLDGGQHQQRGAPGPAAHRGAGRHLEGGVEEASSS